VKLARSSRSEKADLNQTPWLIKPLETILGNECSEVVLLAPTGGGKSTMMEVAITYIVAEKPGPTLVCTQSDPDAYEWFQTGIKPALESCQTVHNLWPTKRNLIRKDFVQFSHMPLWVCGANLNNLQSKSCDNVFFDEAWLAKSNLIAEGRRRTHDRFNSKVILCSQAGTEGDDLSIAWNQCFKHEFSYKCKGCNEFHAYNWKDVKFECDKNNDEYVWESLVSWYECPSCNQRYDDTVNDRREMSSSGSYIETGSDNPVKGHIGYHFSALNVWWIPWSKLVIEFLKANQYLKVGNINYLRQFNQKRLAVAWNDMSLSDESTLNIGDYSIEDRQKWDTTILAVDVQKQDLWYTIRTWSKSGDSRLLECGKVVNFHDLEIIQKSWDIKNRCVFLDTAFRTEEVKGVIAKYNWLGLNGRSENFYNVRNKKTGKTYKQLYSMPNRHKTASGEAIITYYSSNSVKDVLFILKSGHGAEFGVPYDIGDEYINQLRSEIKVIGQDGSPTYKKIKVNNHLLDCEAMQIVGALIHNVYPNVIPQD